MMFLQKRSTLFHSTWHVVTFRFIADSIEFHLLVYAETVSNKAIFAKFQISFVLYFWLG